MRKLLLLTICISVLATATTGTTEGVTNIREVISSYETCISEEYACLGIDGYFNHEPLDLEKRITIWVDNPPLRIISVLEVKTAVGNQVARKLVYYPDIESEV